ncbi:Spy/CpxP family protein refolding chaperone [Geoalkalibacter halelectricus]|uniref:Spy/CpxP family protein refolding chaperone n=1 Tax=Geoalkalibacter halelectricus TaxID=2847045 RepID=A0ABY5ZM86_9BACT|nr:Spy/CpxP family protein refolding chaperone [Geoalkalibacter halelectricus]MDO3378505.1 Spy/CpxP family protein refolding chaperone [Geoalkalibacter halelectricus]UWZ80178.1 Spy/CpxP family protein refolding chaperone [Geoalkalibacter halelectricus]
MKKPILLIALLSLSLAGGQALSAVSAEAASDTERPGYERGERRDHPQARHLQRLAEELQLSAEQREQIGVLIDEHRTRTAAHRQTLGEGRAQLHQMVRAQTFDEAGVRGLAAERNAAKTELWVERARMKHQIHGLLTPEQRELAEEKIHNRKTRGGEGRQGKGRR